MIATIGKVIEQPGSLTIQTARPDAENLSGRSPCGERGLK